VLDVQHEPGVGKEVAGDVPEEVRVLLDDGVAATADQVNVPFSIRRVVRRRAVGEMGVRDEPEVLEQLKSAVNRGQVDSTTGPSGLTVPAGQRRVDPLRRRMPEAADGVEDELTLRGEPETSGAERLDELRRRRVRCR